jgi:hypothetical protein
MYLTDISGPNNSTYLDRYSREFVITVNVITEFDYVSNFSFPFATMSNRKYALNMEVNL